MVQIFYNGPNEQPQLKLRNKERNQVFHANTERYKVLSVLYLQRLLNKNQNVKFQDLDVADFTVTGQF